MNININGDFFHFILWRWIQKHPLELFLRDLFVVLCGMEIHSRGHNRAFYILKMYPHAHHMEF